MNERYNDSLVLSGKIYFHSIKRVYSSTHFAANTRNLIICQISSPHHTADTVVTSNKLSGNLFYTSAHKWKSIHFRKTFIQFRHLHPRSQLMFALLYWLSSSYLQYLRKLIAICTTNFLSWWENCPVLFFNW